MISCKQIPYTKEINGHAIEFKDGKCFIDSKHKFLKIGKPLRNYADENDVEQLINDLPRIKEKQYDCLELNCYWHHFDEKGTGEITANLEPLNRLVDAILQNDMFPCLSVETYGVGGGQIPSAFWERHPDALARNHLGDLVRDTEYGYDTAVPSIFNKDYTTAVRNYIFNLTSALGGERFLHFETTVEPQYMGSQWLDYSDDAMHAYEQWLQDNKIDGPIFPQTFPIQDSFLNDPTWNKFRAQALADWVNGDAAAFRKAAGENAIIAADYLDADEETMVKRCGNAIEFLKRLSVPNIIQVNWSWHIFDREPNSKAYDRVHQAMKDTGRDWAIAEHMTFNGCDFQEEDIEMLLQNTLNRGTRYGWEFADIAPDRDDPSHPLNHILPGAFKPCHFAVYDRDWKPKPIMAVVENRWDHWLKEAYKTNSSNTEK